MRRLVSVARAQGGAYLGTQGIEGRERNFLGVGLSFFL